MFAFDIRLVSFMLHALRRLFSETVKPHFFIVSSTLPRDFETEDIFIIEMCGQLWITKF